LLLCIGLIAVLAVFLMSAMGTFMGHMMQMPRPAPGM